MHLVNRPTERTVSDYCWEPKPFNSKTMDPWRTKWQRRRCILPTYCIPFHELLLGSIAICSFFQMLTWKFSTSMNCMQLNLNLRRTVMDWIRLDWIGPWVTRFDMNQFTSSLKDTEMTLLWITAIKRTKFNI